MRNKKKAQLRVYPNSDGSWSAKVQYEEGGWYGVTAIDSNGDIVSFFPTQEIALEKAKQALQTLSN